MFVGPDDTSGLYHQTDPSAQTDPSVQNSWATFPTWPFPICDRLLATFDFGSGRFRRDGQRQANYDIYLPGSTCLTNHDRASAGVAQWVPRVG